MSRLCWLTNGISSRALFEARDSFRNGRVIRKQGGQAAAGAKDFQRLKGGSAGGFGGSDFGIVEAAQSSECVNHVSAAGQASAAGIGPELALTRKPGDDNVTENGENNLEDLDKQELHPAAAAIAVVIP